MGHPTNTFDGVATGCEQSRKRRTDGPYAQDTWC
jgi:hypothetical protein